MKAIFQEYFRPGIVHFMAFPETMDGKTNIEHTIKKIACDEYFEVMEITWIDDPDTRGLVKNLCGSAKINVVFGAQPVLLRNKLNLNDENPDVRKKSIETMKKCIDQAYDVAAEGISFLSGNYEEQHKQRAFDLLIESTEEICRYAKEKNSMMVELEIFDYDIDKKSLIGPTNLARDFAKKIRGKFDNFGLLVDLSHIPLVKESSAQAIVPVKDFITHIHIGNCFISDRNSPLYGDQHPPFGTPGSENDVEQLAEFLQVLLDTGFFDKKQRPIVSFEVKPLKDQDPDIVIANSKRTLNQAWLLVNEE